jgi:hypothetical protein
VARNKIDFDAVRKIALKLPDVEESTSYGSPALKVRGELVACIPINKSVEPGSLAVATDFDQRAELIASDPDVYYVTDHYVDHPIVLVRLARIHADALPDLLKMAWQFAAKKAKRHRPRSR